MKKENQNTIAVLSARLNDHIFRIDGEKAVLRKRLAELQTKAETRHEKRGFKIEDVEASATAASNNARRIVSIRKALEKPYLDDLEFCKDAALYADSITDEIQQLDERRKRINERVLAKREELRQLEAEAEKERGAIAEQIADLLEPMKASSNFTIYGELSGAYALDRAKQEIERFVSSGGRPE